jgi:nicotinate-nucleotide adenylyltransferase
LGGSFDPVHAGHLFVARTARERAGLDEVLFVPAARPPHKPDRVLTPGPDRLALIEAALEGQEGLRVVELELGREGPSYTIDTVRALEEELGGRSAVELHLILGGDSLVGLGTWREALDLLERVTPLVVHRGEELEGVLERVGGDLPKELLEKLRCGLIHVEPHAVSSTRLREQLERREDPGEDFPEGCLAIVKERCLYGWSS